MSQSKHPPWLVRAKVMPPRQSFSAVRRNLLLSRLELDGQSSTILLEAPAGFGKSTLLSQCRSFLMEKGENTAWLTLSADDVNDVLVAYIAFALEEAGLNINESFWSIAFDETSSSGSLALAVLLNAIGTSHAKIHLFLDDVENVSDEASLNLLDQLIRQAPENLSIKLAYRRNPGLRVSDLLVQGTAQLITKEDLRFQQGEVSEFFSKLMNAGDLELVYAETEGWPFALQVIKSELTKLNGQPWKAAYKDPAGLAASYLQEQVLAPVEPEHLEILYDLSVLDWVHPDAAEHVTGVQNALQLVQTYPQIESLLTFVDDNDQTYRFHPMLREVLVARLMSENADRYKTVSRLAARWMAQNDRLLSALGHAKNADDEDLIAEIIEGAGATRLWLRRGGPRLYAVDAFISDAMLERFPRLALMRSILLGRSGRYKQAQEVFDTASKTIRQGAVSSELRFEELVAELTLTIYGCMPITRERLEALSEAIKTDSEKELSMLTYQHTLLCIARYQSAEFSEARLHADKGIETLTFLQGGEASETGVYFQFHCALIEMAQGNAQSALSHLATARKTIRKRYKSSSPLNFVYDVLLLELHLERQETAVALRVLPNVQKRISKTESWFDIYAAAFSSIVDHYSYGEEWERCAGFLDFGRDFAKSNGISKLLEFLDDLELQILTRQGVIGDSDAPRIAERLTLALEQSQRPFEVETWRETEAKVIALAELLAAKPKLDVGANQIVRFAAAFKSASLSRPRIRISVLSAVRHWKLGEAVKATALLREALTESQRTGFERVFWIHKNAVASLMEAALPALASITQVGPDFAGYVSDLVRRLQEDEGAGNQLISFSPRELSVIQELAKGLSDKMIARNLNISENTVRFHLKNIFAKTGSSNRTEALFSIRQRGLAD